MTVSRNVGTINPAEVSFIFDNHLLSGYVKGTQIGIEYNSDGFTPYKGNDGESARVMTNDNSVIITVTLMQTSLSNDVLSSKHTKDRNTGNGYGEVEFKDNKGTSEGAGSDAYIMGYASQNFSDNVEAREWKIYVPNYEGIVGSNSHI